MAFVMQFSFAQEKTVTGTVTSTVDGLPLPGVNVIVKGTSRGVQTDFDGKYALKTKEGETLVFSFVSMKTFEAVVGSSNTIDVTLAEDIASLDEVMVVAYGTAKKSSVLGSVSVVSSEVIEQVPVASFEQILKGQSPGLHVISGSGQPGTAAKVRIRGTHSINGGSSPLYILDGVPITGSDFATLNPNDFASVSVLKDAGATAIYGSRGSSGVILITTKKGKAGEKTRVKYSTQFGVSEVGELRFEMMNAQEKMTFENWQNPGTWSNADIANAETTDWSDYFFRQGTTTTHDFAISGGNERTSFYTSLSYYDQEGIGIRSDLKRFTFRSNLDHKVSDKFKVGVTSSIGYSKSNFVSSEGGINLNNPFAAVYLAQPYHLPYNADGSYNTGGNLVGGNALQNLNENISKQNDLKIIASAYGELEFAKNLTARASAGVDYINRVIESGIGPDTYLGQNGGLSGNQGSYSFNNQFVANINAITSINYSNVWKEVHSFSASAFMEYYKFHSQGGNYTGFGIDPKLVGYAAGVSAGTGTNGFIPTVGGSVAERGLFSVFANAKYNYDEKYFVDATIRRDASSRFSEANKWGTFYALSLGWQIHQEDFFNASWVDILKLRTSFGVTGNQAGIGDFQDQGTYATTSYNGISGIVANSIGNDQLKWEESEKFNLGLDYGLLNNRISGSFDFYVENISDLFIQQQLSLTSGFGSIDANVGKMQNKGFDGMINGVVLRNDDFSWSLNVNFNYNKNEITDLGQEEEYELGTSIVREGLPFGSHYAVGWAGVNPANGAPLYLDADGNVTDVFSSDNSLADWGSYEPVWTGGFGTQVQYKGFSVSAAFTFAQDYYRFNNQTFFQENPNFSQFNLSTAMLSIWRTPGDVTDIQGFGYNREFSSKDIENASYTRLSNVTVSYTLPAKHLERVNFIDGIRVYAQGVNLYTWTNFSGFDPEDSNNIASYEYPTPRTITFGLDLNF